MTFSADNKKIALKDLRKRFVNSALLTFVFLVVGMTIGSSSSSILADEAEFRPAKTLEVVRCAVAPEIDGIPADSAWLSIPSMTDFSYPWREDKPEYTSLKLCYDDNYLYVLFEVQDSSFVFKPEQKKEMDIAEEDRVEVFFSADPKMKKYFGVEMSPSGKALDYFCTFHRKFNTSWNVPGLILKGRKNLNSYVVEAAFSMAELKKFGVLQEDGRIIAGFYRADFEYGPDGRVIEKWISWINPNLKEVDFHVPETLGLLILKDYSKKTN